MNKKVLVFGASGLIGSRFVELIDKDFEINAPSQEDLDLFDTKKAVDYIKVFNPETILNFTGYTAVDKAEEEDGDKNGLVYKINVGITEFLAKVSKDLDSLFVHISSDYIFDGTKNSASYKEEYEPNPLSWYGKTKYFADQAVLESGSKYLIARIQMPYRTDYNVKIDFANYFYKQLKAGNEVQAINNGKITPIFIDHLIEALNEMINKGVEGIYNLATTDNLTLYDFVKMMARTFQFDESLIKPITFEEYIKTRLAKRPKNTWFDITKFEKEFGKGILHTNKESLEKFKQQIDSLE